jgi:hypothetical protein
MTLSPILPEKKIPPSLLINRRVAAGREAHPTFDLQGTTNG